MSWSDEVRTPNFDKHRTATSTPQPAGLKSVKPVSLMREIDARLRRAFVRTACKAIEPSRRGEPFRFAGETSGHRRCTRSPACRLAFCSTLAATWLPCVYSLIGVVALIVSLLFGWLTQWLVFVDGLDCIIPPPSRTPRRRRGVNANATFRGSGASERRLAAAQRVPTTLRRRQYQGRSSPHVPRHHPAAGSHLHQRRCHRASPTRHLAIGDPDSGP